MESFHPEELRSISVASDACEDWVGGAAQGVENDGTIWLCLRQALGFRLMGRFIQRGKRRFGGGGVSLHQRHTGSFAGTGRAFHLGGVVAPAVAFRAAGQADGADVASDAVPRG